MIPVDLARRRFMATLLGGVVALRGTAPARAQSAPPAGGELPHLDESDKMAIAFAYVADATKVDKTKNPSFKPKRTCANCLLATGKEGATWRPCKIFPGKAVNAAGWCKTWLKKT